LVLGETSAPARAAAPGALACWRLERPPAQLAELTSGAPSAEEEDVVLLVVVIALDEIRVPTASFRISATPAFDAHELAGMHRPDDAAKTVVPESGQMGQLRGDVIAPAMRRRSDYIRSIDRP
jgi:hypothetical protein